MSDYSEHLISMAGGDWDVAEADRETKNLATIVRLDAENEALRATIARVLNLANTAGRCGWRISADELRTAIKP